jgi:hypothetical protein
LSKSLARTSPQRKSDKICTLSPAERDQLKLLEGN